MATVLRKGAFLSRWNLEWQGWGEFYWLEYHPLDYPGGPAFPMFLDIYQVTCDVQLRSLTNTERRCDKASFFASMWDNRGSQLEIPEEKRPLLSKLLQAENHSGFFSVNNGGGHYEVYLLNPATVLEHKQRVQWRVGIQWILAPVIEWYGPHAEIHM
jgi:hypothetical protein